MRLVTAFTFFALAVCCAGADADVYSNAIRKSTTPAPTTYVLRNTPVQVAQETQEGAAPAAAVENLPVPDDVISAPVVDEASADETVVEGTVVEGTVVETAGEVCPNCGQVHSAQPVQYYAPAAPQNQNVFQRVWSLEKRKNAWLKRTFFK